MADTKISALTAATALAAADQFAINQSSASKSITASLVRSYVGAGLSNASTAAVAASYAVDTYLAGSSITLPVAGGWRVGTQYSCLFDMVKTAAGTAAFTITVRMGTLGTTGDGTLFTLAFAVGTAAVDTGMFEVLVNFRSVGVGSGVAAGSASCNHHLAATGLVSTGASGYALVLTNATALTLTSQTIIGLSINGGASFSGTNTMVQAYALNV